LSSTQKKSRAKPQSRKEGRQVRDQMTENEVPKIIVDSSFQIHSNLGPGLLESVYEQVLAYELTKRGLSVKCQVVVPVFYEGLQFEQGFCADLVVEGCVIVELKSVEKVAAVHKKQLLTYLRLTDLRLGLLVNFGEALIRDGITRIVNGLAE
jgi:GxxExxY protein